MVRFLKVFRAYISRPLYDLKMFFAYDYTEVFEKLAAFKADPQREYESEGESVPNIEVDLEDLFFIKYPNEDPSKFIMMLYGVYYAFVYLITFKNVYFSYFDPFFVVSQ
jgi:hypothetical protein